MALRLSFTIDSELSKRLDNFTKKQELDRNEAILRLLESGLLQAEQSGIIPPAHERDFKEYAKMQMNVDMLLRNIDELKKEVRVMHHMINLERKAPEKKSVHKKLFGK
ncbi:MAG: hypothetical protein Q4Q53_02695 [Methanocorpusculum sp.]|nr:hypothetical protein [Methanocorpusculum sp.]